MATARAFIAEGARVLLAGVSEPDLTAGAADLGERAAWKVTDVTDSAQVKAAVAAAVRQLGATGRRRQVQLTGRWPTSRRPSPARSATTGRP